MEAERPTRTWLNVAVNLAGRLVTAVVGLFLAPYFFRSFGAEAYGLIGFHNTLASVLALLNLGFGTVFATELAGVGRLEDESQRQRARDLLHTYGRLYTALGLLLGGLCFLLAPYLAEYAVHRETLTLSETTDAVRLMGIAILLSWPLGIFSSALASIEKQVSQNVILVVSTLARTAMLVAMLHWWTNDVRAYFGLLLALTLATLAATLVVCWRAVSPNGETGRWSPKLFRGHGAFALHATVIAVSSTLLNQLDRLVVTKELALSLVGYYSLATTLGQMMYFFATPVFSAYQPQLIQLVAERKHDAVVNSYRQATRVIVSLLAVPCLILCFFSSEILLAWTHDPQVAPLLAWPLRMLVLATSIHGLMHVPHALMVAHRWMAPSAVFNVVALLAMVPGAAMLTRHFGLTGAAASWLIVQTANGVILASVVHRKLMPGLTSNWVIRDVVGTMLPALAVIATARMLVPVAASRIGVFIEMAAIGAIALIATLAAEPDARRTVLVRLRLGGA